MADVGVADGRIAAVSPDLSGVAAAERVWASGLLLCPGCIDLHAHSALAPFRDPELAPKIAQGFTTEVICPDGMGPAPVAPDRARRRAAELRPIEGSGPVEARWGTLEAYTAALDATRPATTLLPSAAHGAVRDVAIPDVHRAASTKELERLRIELRRALEAGAWAVSLGLVYPPGSSADRRELLVLCEEAARAGVPVMVHVRNEGDGVREAVREMIDACRPAGASLHLSHLKAIGRAVRLDQLLELVEDAARSLDITFDAYPYGAGCSSLVSSLPPWSQLGTTEQVVDRLRDPSTRARIRLDVERGLPGWEDPFRAMGPAAYVIADVAAPRQDDLGRTLAEIAAERGTDPLSTALDLLVDTSLMVTTIEHFAQEAAIADLLAHPLALVGSDAIFAARPHPRLFGTAARVLGRYALTEHRLSVEEAVAKMTARSANRIGLRDTGRIREGARADLVLVDPHRFIDRATYEEPTLPPDGVELVVVGGVVVRRDGRATGLRNGRAILRAPADGRG